ncbi:MAG: response regulator transcription factor [Alphaproteobacteria bacterium]|nr:response regulator transcription factor [Alphaproteobacteria bacterium]
MKVLVVDDHVLIREALCSVLTELLPNISVFEASDYSQAIKLVEQYSDLNLITLDLALPDRDGFSVLAELREHCPAIAVVVLSASRDPADIARAMDMGAAGYIPKTTKREVMLSAFQLILSGGTYIPAEILDAEHAATQPIDSSPLTASLTKRLQIDLGLTGRQVEVLALMMQGKSNKAIARMLNLAEPTVKNHVTAILKGLDVNNRTEAVIKIGKIERAESAITGSSRAEIVTRNPRDQ